MNDVTTNNPSYDLIPDGDLLFTLQWDDDNDGDYYQFFLYKIMGSFITPSGVNYFEPGRGYFIEFTNDLYLYWRLGECQSGGGDDCDFST